jgi:hypothetical protein
MLLRQSFRTDTRAMVVMYTAMGVPMDVSEFGRQECPSLPFAEWRERRSQEAFGAVLVPVLMVGSSVIRIDISRVTAFRPPAVSALRAVLTRAPQRDHGLADTV